MFLLMPLTAGRFSVGRTLMFHPVGRPPNNTAKLIDCPLLFYDLTFAKAETCWYLSECVAKLQQTSPKAYIEI